MTDSSILDKSGNTRIRVTRRPFLREGFSIGTEAFADDLSGIRDSSDIALMRQRSRAALNHALLAQRPIHGGKSLPLAQDPQDNHLVETLACDGRFQFGKTDISLSIKSGRWDQDDIFARQPHSAWMRFIDDRIGARRSPAAGALRNYWRLICLEMPDLGPERDAEVTVRIPKTLSGLPVLVIDGVIFHAVQATVPELIRMTLNHGGRGFVSVGPGPAGGDGSLHLSLVALVAPSQDVLADSLQTLPETSLP